MHNPLDPLQRAALDAVEDLLFGTHDGAEVEVSTDSVAVDAFLERVCAPVRNEPAIAWLDVELAPHSAGSPCRWRSGDVAATDIQDYESDIGWGPSSGPRRAGRIRLGLRATALAPGDVQAALDDLGRGLTNGLRLIRRHNDMRASMQIVEALSEPQAGSEAIQDIADAVDRRIPSDGVKIYLLRRTPLGARFERRFRSDDPSARVAHFDIEENRGLADWCILKKDWLLVTDPAPHDRRGQQFDRGISGCHGAVERRARPGRESDPADTTGDRERTVLLVPIPYGGTVVGALAVWRYDEDQGFEPDLDRGALSHLASHIGVACRQLLLRDAVRQEARLLSRFGWFLERRITINATQKLLAHSLQRLASATGVVLMKHFSHGRNQLFSCAERTVPGVAFAEDSWRLRVDVSRDPEEWAAALLPAFQSAHATRDGQPVSLRIRRVVPLLGNERPIGAAVFFDIEPGEFESELSLAVLDDTDDEVVMAFAAHVSPMLASLIRSIDHTVRQQLAARVDRRADRSVKILRKATKFLRDLTHANLVIACRPDDTGQSLEIIASTPKLNRSALKDANQLLATLRQQPIGLVPDTHNATADAKLAAELDEVVQAMRWRGTRSLLYRQLCDDDGTLGWLLLLTRSGSHFVGEIHGSVLESAAAQAIVELRLAQRQQMLERLNALSHTLVGEADSSRTRFALQLVSEVGQWLSEYVRPDCKIALLARLAKPEFEVIAADAGLNAAERAQLTQSATTLPNELARFDQLGNRHGLSAALEVPGVNPALGFLLVLSPRPFTANHRDAIGLLARELTLLVDRIRLDYRWVQQMGLFRHAVLGPVQGLQSAALLMGRLAETAGADANHVQRATSAILRDAEAVRLWRENQRVYTSAHIDVITHAHSMRDLLENCYHRFEGPIRARGIRTSLRILPAGGIEFPFDAQAIDVVVSNLLENARKYAFDDESITVTCSVNTQFVRVAVESIGHGIPTRLATKIYEVGYRFDSHDPVRTIDGTGLGLPMSRKIARAHNGDIYHESRALPNRPTRSGKPHRVTFTLDLPHYWRRRGN